MGRHGVEAVKKSGVNVCVVCELFAGGVVCYVSRLAYEVIGVSDPVFVVSAVPDFSLLTCCEGVSAFKVLNAFCG